MQKVRAGMAAALMLCAMAAAPGMAAAQGQQPEKKTDLTGKWLFSVTSDAGTGTPTVSLKQKGDTLTGHYSSEALGEAELKGTVTGQKFTFTFNVDLQGTALKMTYAGTMEGADALKGTVDFGGMASGTFTAKRQP